MHTQAGTNEEISHIVQLLFSQLVFLRNVKMNKNLFFLII